MGLQVALKEGLARSPAHPLPLQVADVCVEALVCDAAANKVVEVIAETGVAPPPLPELFAAVR